jgi:hypothetical protein
VSLRLNPLRLSDLLFGGGKTLELGNKLIQDGTEPKRSLHREDDPTTPLSLALCGWSQQKKWVSYKIASIRRDKYSEAIHFMFNKEIDTYVRTSRILTNFPCSLALISMMMVFSPNSSSLLPSSSTSAHTQREREGEFSTHTHVYTHPHPYHMLQHMHACMHLRFQIWG